MAGHDNGGRDIRESQFPIRGHQMDVRPLLVVLAVFEYGKVNAPEHVSDGLKVRAVTAVAGEVELVARDIEHEARPKRRVHRHRAAGEVLRGQAGEFKVGCKTHGLIPDGFRDPLGIVAPGFKVRPHPQRTDHTLNA